MDLKTLHLLVLSIAAALAQVDWEKQCNKCHCLWVSGKKSANCTRRNLDVIPGDLSGEIREIDFSFNYFTTLEQKVFSNAHLGNIHKLKLANCTIRTVNQWAFSGLALLIELDLSNNFIAHFNSEVFRPTDRLRTLTLSNNRISRLDDRSFYNMSFLQKILLDHNEIETVSRRTFDLLPLLTHISLAHNRIQRIDFDMKLFLPKLSSMGLEGNPWVCDCRLQAFRESSRRNSLITTLTVCQEPPGMRDKSWMEQDAFACEPRVVEMGPRELVEVSTENVTLTCKVSGDPEPEVSWWSNGIAIDKNKQKYSAQKVTESGFTWSKLTIVNVGYKDRGTYKCQAENSGGKDEKNVTVAVTGGSASGPAYGGLAARTYLVVGVSIGLLVALLAVLAVLFCFCRRSTHGFHAKRRRGAGGGSEEYIHMSGGQAEIKKGLITDVNPVSKPPRTTIPAAAAAGSGGGAGVGDAKGNLLDSDSVFYDCEDETRSLDFDQPLLRRSRLIVDPTSDYRLPPHPHAYPPDLLPFPPSRMVRVSPAGSSASTVADTTRLPPHHGPQSPVHSPIYDQFSVCRTLPYSRSRSPFVGPPVRVPRQGYVTIPRRPRQQSWSSEPPNMSDLASEPLYDNLGLRTTVDGGLSTTSLNKVEASAGTPRAARLLPLSPTGCDPIAESHESPPAPQQTPATLPRGAGHANARQLTPSEMQWTRDNAEALRSPDKRDSTVSLPPEDSTKQPSKKIPPRPPPKPKKRLSTGGGGGGGPLFEDEGEDGTEV